MLSLLDSVDCIENALKLACLTGSRLGLGYVCFVYLNKQKSNGNMAT